jgi:hypothetical protein
VAARGAGEQPAMPVIGFLNSASADGYAPMASAFRQGLKDIGYVEGSNVVIEYRWAENQYDRARASNVFIKDKFEAVAKEWSALAVWAELKRSSPSTATEVDTREANRTWAS